jgi:hypothetical protein
MLYNMVYNMVQMTYNLWYGERIIQDFAREKKIDATFVKDLIQKVLHHPDFDADDVDHDMHERLMAAIEEGDLQIIDLKEHGDGEQDVRLFKRPAGKVLRELLADPRLAGCQHFAFKEYKAATQMVQCPFNWPRSGLVQTLFPFP